MLASTKRRALLDDSLTAVYEVPGYTLCGRGVRCLFLSCQPSDQWGDGASRYCQSLWPLLFKPEVSKPSLVLNAPDFPNPNLSHHPPSFTLSVRFLLAYPRGKAFFSASSPSHHCSASESIFPTLFQLSTNALNGTLQSTCFLQGLQLSALMQVACSLSTGEFF